MSYKSAKIGTDPWWNEKIEKGIIKSRPGNKKCMFCNIDTNTKSLSICKDCPK